MPIDFSRKLIFVHIPKNAGRSIEFALGLDYKELMEPRKRSILSKLAIYYLRRNGRKNLERMWGTYDYTFALQHTTWREISDISRTNGFDLNPEWRSFAIIRDPRTRLWSSYKHFRFEGEGLVDFLSRFSSISFIQDHNKLAHRRRQVDYLKGASNIWLLRFEHLENDFITLKTRLGLLSSDLPILGENKRIIDEHEVELIESYVQEHYSEDLDLFNKINSYDSLIQVSLP